MRSKTTNKFSSEVRARAVRMVLDHEGGAYNTMVQKQVVWLADIGNKAAHGDTAGYKDADASHMIAHVEGS